MSYCRTSVLRPLPLGNNIKFVTCSMRLWCAHDTRRVHHTCDSVSCRSDVVYTIRSRLIVRISHATKIYRLNRSLNWCLAEISKGCGWNTKLYEPISRPWLLLKRNIYIHVWDYFSALLQTYIILTAVILNFCISFIKMFNSRLILAIVSFSLKEKGIKTHGHKGKKKNIHVIS